MFFIHTWNEQQFQKKSGFPLHPFVFFRIHQSESNKKELRIFPISQQLEPLFSTNVSLHCFRLTEEVVYSHSG